MKIPKRINEALVSEECKELSFILYKWMVESKMGEESRISIFWDTEDDCIELLSNKICLEISPSYLPDFLK